MGSGSYSHRDWAVYSSTAKLDTKSVHEIYSRELHESMDPRKVKNGMREARDNEDHPATTALICALDVTGSMGPVLSVMAKQGMNTLVQELYDRKPVADPAIMCMGIGDAEMGDRAPLQVTQFEADIRIQQQLAQLWLEMGGGGNSYESYLLAHYFAAYHTSIDCFEKRGKKGYLFTIGDEEPTPYLKRDDIQRVIGDTVQEDRLTWESILTVVSRQWEVFHIMVAEGNHFRSRPEKVRAAWTNVLGQRAIELTDHTKLAEVIVSLVQVNEGADASKVAGSWDGTTAAVVRSATANLTRAADQTGDLVSL